jgi:hypothetical protein
MRDVQHSPTSRPLVQRRGSVSASDPFGNHAALNLNPSRSSSSTLTIVRIDPSTSPINANFSSVVSSQESASPHRSRHHRRPGSSGSASTQNVASQPPRLSFAFSSFSGHGQVSGGSGSTLIPGARPASPTISSPPSRYASHRPSGPKSRLTPAEVYDLAKQATQPKSLNAPSQSSATTPQAHSEAGIVPAVFTPLPPSVYLPFLDRPSEVTALLTSPPSAKLFSLLQQTFSRNPSAAPASPSVPIQFPSPSDPIEIPQDPLDWSFVQLTAWLVASRTTAPDALYVRNARRCILAHSELIWERVKGALGVPPELDIDWTQQQPGLMWDEMGGSSALSSDDESDYAAEIGVRQAGGEKVEVPAPGSTGRSGGVTKVHAPATPIPQGHVESHPSDSTGSASRSAHTEAQVQVTTEVQGHISISPILASSASINPHPPPLSLPASEFGDGLDDITEDAEEEDTAETKPEEPHAQEGTAHIQGLRISTSPSPYVASAGLPSPQSFSLSRPGSVAGYNGSRPVSRAGSFKGHSRPVSVAHSPVASAHPVMHSSAGSSPKASDRSASFGAGSAGSYANMRTFGRSSSFGSLSGLPSSASQIGSVGSGLRELLKQREAGEDEGSEAGHEDEDNGSHAYPEIRSPTTPHFPSNFANLDAGPTFAAR